MTENTCIIKEQNMTAKINFIYSIQPLFRTNICSRTCPGGRRCRVFCICPEQVREGITRITFMSGEMGYK